ncbi:MAG TPA: DUF1931 family protein [Acidimicrobiales bacterium]|jgi:hypothetical protein|nr:DUF1931 family protein [Acidimicrobiales bacterium]
MAPIGIPKFQHFFRESAGLHVDKDDLKRYTEFVNRKLYDLLIVAEATARANIRDVVQPMDLPITKGLQECMHEFRKLDTEIELVGLLEELETLPPLDLELNEETEGQLPEVAGALTVALAKTIRTLDPGLTSPHVADWDHATKVMDILL